MVGRDVATSPPNVVLVLVDDLGWRDLSCYGSTFHRTPHIDAWAARGVRFRNACAASPVCSPSRASLLTGQHPTRVGITEWIGGHGVGALVDVPYLRELPQHQYTLARALRDAGHRTWHVGKWHLGSDRSLPEHHGFDVNIGGSAQALPGSYHSPYGVARLDDGPPGEYLTDRLTDEAIALVESAGDRPFFLNLWHYAVHTPIQAPPDLIERYRARNGDRDPGDDVVDGEPMTAWHLRGRRVRRRLAQSDPAYAAMVENLDANVGRLLAALDRTGHAQDTVVVLTSDNGGLATAEGSPTSNHPLRDGKGWLHDGGLRVPLIIGDPRHPGSAGVSDVLTSTPDLYPTILELAGVEPSPGQLLDGVSIAGEVTGRRPTAAVRILHWHYPHYSNQGGQPALAVRDGDLKLHRDLATGEQRLYDVGRDPGETDDLAPGSPDVVARLSAELDRWLDDVGALLPRRNPHPAPFRERAR